MRAAVITRYGGPEVVTVEQRQTPTAGPGEVLVRVHAAPIALPDVAARSGRPWFARLAFGLRRPKHETLGGDFSGVVEALGPGTSRFAVGDRVFGTADLATGSHCEYLVVAEDASIERVPDGLDHVGAAAIVDATALAFLRDTAGVRAGQSVLVRGASGTVGSMAVQLAAMLGARVTAVCSAANADWARSLGAHAVVDYASTDYATTGDRYDVVFDAVGTDRFRHARRALVDGGLYMTTVPSFGILLRTLLARPGRTRGVIAFTGLRPTAVRHRDLVDTARFWEQGALRAPVGPIFALADAAEAHRVVEHGKRRGIAVITLADDVAGTVEA